MRASCRPLRPIKHKHFWSTPMPSQESPELVKAESQRAKRMKLHLAFEAKFGRLPGKGLMESSENFELRIKHAMETGDPGTLIRRKRPGGMRVD